MKIPDDVLQIIYAYVEEFKKYYIANRIYPACVVCGSENKRFIDYHWCLKCFQDHYETESKLNNECCFLE